MPENNSRFNWMNLTANGNVRPSRVVVGVNGTANILLAVEATAAGTFPGLGITRENTRFPPGDPADDGLVAIAGEPLQILQPGDIGNALTGAAITDGRMPLTFDNQGRVISHPVAGGGTAFWCVAYPLAPASAAGQKIPVVVVTPFLGPA